MAKYVFLDIVHGNRSDFVSALTHLDHTSTFLIFGSINPRFLSVGAWGRLPGLVR